MRDIEFKGKDNKGIWWHGSLIGVECIVDKDGNRHDVDADTVSEFTGESDVYHDPVYENDIVWFETIRGGDLYKGIVYYEDASFKVDICNNRGVPTNEDNFFFHEVIINERICSYYDLK